MYSLKVWINVPIILCFDLLCFGRGWCCGSWTWTWGSFNLTGGSATQQKQCWDQYYSTRNKKEKKRMVIPYLNTELITTNHAVSQSINQSVSQSISLSVSLSISKSVRESAGLSISQSVSQSGNQVLTQ